MLQVRLGRILRDIANRTSELFLASNEVIIIFPLPKSSMRSEDSVSMFRAEGLPGMNDSCQFLGGKESSNNMNMIWHDAPCEQPVAFQIKVPQCVCQFFRDHGIPQVASARAIIEKLLNDRGREPLDFPALIGAEITVQLICSCNYRAALAFDLI
jgi:hypothetical protein